MCDELNGKKIRENPELFKIQLEKQCEKTTSSLRVYNERKNEKDIMSSFENFLHQLIDDMWIQQDLSNKLLHLGHLEQCSPPNYTAWRPTVGEVPALTFKGNHLQEVKNVLTTELERSQEQLAQLKKTLATKEATLEKQVKKFPTAYEFISKVNNSYKKIIPDEV